MFPKKPQQDGYILIFGIIVMAILVVMSAAVWGYTTMQVKGSRESVLRTQAWHIAEAGVDKAISQLNQSGSYAGEADVSVGNGVFTTTVTSIDASTKQVTSTAYIPDSTNPVKQLTIKLKVGISLSAVSFNFGVQVGDGGIYMGNGSQIIGNLFTNGNASGGGTVTGDLTVAGGTTPAPDQEWTIQDSSFNLGDASARANVAQSFKPSLSATFNKMALYLKKTGSPGDITLKLVSDNGGKPSSTVLATGTLPASSVTTTYNFANASFSTTPSIAAGQTYWVIAIATVSASNYFTWGQDSSNGYVDGTAKYSSNWQANNPTWTLTGGDLDFKMYVGGLITTLDGITVGGNARAHTMSNCTVGAKAYYFGSTTNCTVNGTKYPGTADTAPVSMPISEAQISNWEEQAEAGGVITGPYLLTGTQLLGPKKIDGDLTVNGTLYLTGPVWVSGDIRFANNSSLIVHSSTGTSGAVLMADQRDSRATKGIVDLSNNMTIAGNGNPGTYPMVLSTNSSDNAITMSNNATSVILYASEGTVNVINNAIANQVSAYKLNLSNNTTVQYITGLQNQSFSNGPGGSWALVPGSYVIID
jgi:Tfp pilus assembly protein PilX